MNHIKNLRPDRKSRYTQGYFTPLFPEKYIGDVHKIIYRSSYEHIFYMTLDLDPSVKRWAAESMKIEYISPVDKRIHRYFPDAYIEKVVKGEQVKIIAEIKPLAFLTPPEKKQGGTLKQRARYLENLKKYVIIQAKKRATEKYALKMGYKYLFITETYLKKFDIEKLKGAYKK